MTQWTRTIPDAPMLGDELSKPQLRLETLQFLAERRSLTAAQMTEPGPSGDELSALLRLASRAPDHRRVHPFRFVVIEGQERSVFGDVLAEAFCAAQPEASSQAVELERQRFLRAPTVVTVVSSVDRAHKTPEWEQILTAGAVAQNLVIAASAAGFAAQWLTEWYAFDQSVTSALGLAENERVAGFIYLGTAAEAPKERARLDASELTSYWKGPQTPR